MLKNNSTIFKEQLTSISTVLNNTGNTTKLLTSFSALDVAQQKVLLSSKLLTEEQKVQCATMATLTSANAKYTAEQIAKATGVSAETLANWGLVKSTDTLTISELAEKAASDAQAKSVLEKIIAQNAQAVANGEVTASNVTLAASEGGATLATGAFTTAIKANIKAMWTWMTTTPVGWITMLVGGVLGAVTAYNALTDSVEETKEKAEDLISTYKTALDTANSHKESIDNIADRYEELSKGVNNFGENVSLTAEEYKEYNSIVNDIAEMFPTMVQGYTDEGNAILKLKGNIDALREAYDAEAQAAYNSLISTGKDSDGNDILKDANNVITGSTLGAHDWGNAEKIDYLDKLMDATDSVDSMLNLWDESLNSAYSEWFEDFSGVGGTANIGKLTDEDLANIRKNAKILKQQYQAEIDSAVDNAETLANAYLMTNEDYAKLDEQSKNAASIMVNSLNANIVSKFGEDKENVGKYVNDIVQIISTNSDAKDAMVRLFTMDTTDMSVNDIQTTVDSYISTVATAIGEDPVELKVRLGFDYVDELEAQYQRAVDYAKDKFKSESIDITPYKEALDDEYQKIQDWGLEDYADKIKNGTIQSVFGNVDMDKRTIITWSDELKQTYADALSSWDYDPEVGSIDTVFGGSNRFGEELNGVGWEVAFTPILPDGTFLSQDAVYDYINTILEEAYANDGKVTEDELVAIDAQGRQIGNTFVHGIFAGIDDSQNYDNNGNWAETVGRLMHFSGDFGAVQIAKDAIEKAKKQESDFDWDSWFKENSINTQEEIDRWNEIAESATNAADARKKYTEGEEGNETDISFADSLKELDKLTEAFSKVDKIYADVYDKEGFDFSNLFDDKFIETFGKYEEEYKNLIDTISKSPDDINACQSAFNNLVNTWFYAQDVLKNLNEENKNATIQYLKQNGIANASAIVTTVLAGNKLYETNQTELLSDANEILSSKTDEASVSAENHTMELLKQSGATSETINWVMKLVAQQTIFSHQELSVESKINSLERLAKAYGQTAFAARLASNLDNIKKNSLAYNTAAVLDIVTGTHKATDAVLSNTYNKTMEEFNNLTAPSINYTGGSATQSAKDKKDKKSKSGGSAKGGSAKEHETNDEYYNFFQTKIEDYKNGADKLKKAIEETNEQIELAYKTGDTKLAKSLEAMLPQQTQQYKDYLAANAKAMRKMAKEEIYPIIYQIAPELKGKTIDQFSEKEKLEIKRRLDNAKTDAKNKVIDLENAQKDSDNKTKVSDADVKNAEKQLKILEALYPTLEKSYELVGNKAGEGEWSKNYREMINDQIDAIKDSLDKDIERDEFNLSLFENMDNQEGMLNVYLQELDRYHNAAKKLKELGLSENSAEIQEQQKNYRETFEKIFELGKDVFEKLKKKREDALNTVEFKFDMTGEKEYGKQIGLLNDETAIHQDNINKIIERMNALKKDYRNHIIVAAEYEEEIRSLNEELKEEVQNLKSIAEQRRDIEIAKIDDQIDDLTRATEKQTKAIDEKIYALEKESDELDKLKNLYDKAYSAIQKVVDDQIEELNDLKEQEEEYWDEKLEALEKINEETTRGIELSEKQKAIEEARQRTALVYHEDKGWVHEANPNDLSAAQQDLDQWLIDDQFEQAKKSIEEQKEASLNAIEEQIEAWDKYIEKWEDAVNAYEDGQDRIAASTVIGANWEKSTLAQREDIIRKFETNYSALLKQLDEDNKNSIENQIEEFNKQKDAIEKASDAQIEKLNNLKSAYEELFNDLSTDSVEWVKSIIEKWELDISVKDELLKLLKVRKDELLNAKAEAEKPLAYNNDDITIIKQMMGYSQKWLEAINQQDKDQLHEKNIELAKALSFEVHFDNEKYSWFDENGDAIYSDEFLEKLEEEQKITDENNKSTDINTDVTEDNTTSVDTNTNATKDNNKALKGTKDALNKATNIGNDIVDAAESLTDALNNSSKSSSNGSTNSSSESSSSSSSDTITYPTDGTPYTYSSTLVGEDIETASKWFEDNHKTNPGTDIKVVHGGVSTLSVDLINQLGLASGDLVALGKQLYYIKGSGSYSKITGSLVNKYAKGSKYIPYDQIALVNEEGDELIASKNSQGDITKLRKSDEVVPAKDTQTLMSLVDWVNDPNNANNPKYEEFSNILAMQKKFMDYLSNNSNSFDTIATIKNNKLLNDLSKGNILNNLTTNNNNGMVNHNYNIQKVELNNVQDPSGLFNGLSNMARQRAFRR